MPVDGFRGPTSSGKRFRLVPRRGGADVRSSATAVLLAPPWRSASGYFCSRLRGRPPGELLARGPALLRGLRSVREGSHLYVPFSEAGAAIWYGFPRGVRVFFDSRNDCYSPETFRSFLLLGERGTPKPLARQILDRSHTDAVLIQNGHPLSFLGDETGWARQFAEGELVPLRQDKRSFDRNGVDRVLVSPLALSGSSLV